MDRETVDSEKTVGKLEELKKGRKLLELEEEEARQLQINRSGTASLLLPLPRPTPPPPFFSFQSLHLTWSGRR